MEDNETSQFIQMQVMMGCDTFTVLRYKFEELSTFHATLYF